MPQDDLAKLVTQIEDIVSVSVNDPKIRAAELRRVLRFVSQVVQVVEQSFQDALSLLVEVKFLRDDDFGSPKIAELQKQCELLTARSYYRDAVEICSRLKHLREEFDQFVRPSIGHLP